MSEPRRYRPSNGTEGECFQADFCERCIHDGWPEAPCGILGKVFFFSVDHPEYPPQWVYGADGKPTCTAFEPREGGDA